MRNKNFKEILLAALAIVVVTFLLLTHFSANKKTAVDRIEKGELPLKSFTVDESRLRNAESQQIFFLETHLDGRRSLENSKQVCSVEAAARTNPDMDVYLFLATNETQVTLTATPLLNVLLSYPNIRVRYINVDEFTKGTKLEEFFQSKVLETSQYQVEHTSDILRVLALNKYGGLYMDLDVISLYPVRLLRHKNFCCLELTDRFNNAIIKLDRVEGRKYSDAYLEQVIAKYKPDEWAVIGPVLVTAVFRSFCNSTILDKDKTSQCDKITAFATDKCFPLEWKKFIQIAAEFYTDSILDTLIETGAYFIHVWNHSLKMFKGMFKLNRDSEAAYIELAKVYCPRTVAVKYSF